MHRPQNRQVVLFANFQVIRAEGRGDMHNTRTVFRTDKITRDDVGVIFFHRHEGIQRVVVHPR